MADPTIDDVINMLGSTDFGSQMLDTLKSMGKMPTITQGNVTSSDANGEYDPTKNTIALAPNFMLYGTALKNALTHELTHSLDNAMGSAVFTKESAVDPYTKEQYSKFSEAKSYQPIADLIGKARPGDYYRQDYGESAAFGVGNSIFPAGRYDIPHADASRAQEEAIKLDLFKRGQKTLQQQKAAKTSEPNILTQILSLLGNK